MKTVLALAAVTLAEATIGVFVKLTGDAVPIYTLNFYRVLFAALFLAVGMSTISGRFWRLPKDNLRDIVIIGALVAAQISFFNIAMSLAPIANVVIFWSVAPFFVFILSWLFLDEPAQRTHIAIFVVAIVGLVIARPLEGGNMLGNVIALGDGAIYAGLVTFMRHERNTESTNDVFWYMLVATILLLPAVFIFGPGAVMAVSAHTLFGLEVPTLLWVIGLGVVSTGVAYMFITIALQRISANVYSLVDIVVSPVVAAVFGYLIFNEVPSTNLVFGGVLLLGSGFWLARTMVQDQPAEREQATGS
ncbi:MAG: EamA family transporter [Actinobacteria bacterium QS_8_72_14]|nr:MAG: EamA family transporter [Actinobacteria bacterium QS_8_72_14]